MDGSSELRQQIAKARKAMVALRDPMKSKKRPNTLFMIGSLLTFAPMPVLCGAALRSGSGTSLSLSGTIGLLTMTGIGLILAICRSKFRSEAKQETWSTCMSEGYITICIGIPSLIAITTMSLYHLCLYKFDLLFVGIFAVPLLMYSAFAWHVVCLKPKHKALHLIAGVILTIFVLLASNVAFGMLSIVFMGFPQL